MSPRDLVVELRALRAEVDTMKAKVEALTIATNMLIESVKPRKPGRPKGGDGSRQAAGRD